jgi:hypothetical protein
LTRFPHELCTDPETIADVGGAPAVTVGLASVVPDDLAENWRP